MFDFRYHALSLAAVFLALVVGLLLGVAIGDEELVSCAEDIRDSLREDVRRPPRARRRARRSCAEQRFGAGRLPGPRRGPPSGRASR